MEELIEGVNAKVCGICKELKPRIEFSKDNRNKRDGLQHRCKDCLKQYHNNNRCSILEVKKAYRLANKAELARKEAEIRQRNPEHYSKYLADYYKRNKVGIQKQHSDYYQNNKAMFFAHGAKRRAAKLKRTPAWLSEQDQRDIEDFYYLARALTEVTGIPYVVDHILPLQGKLVSGLHHPGNLQILTESENASKGNKYTPE